MKIELEPEQLTALIEHLGALTIRYERKRRSPPGGRLFLALRGRKDQSCKSDQHKRVCKHITKCYHRRTSC